MKLQEQGREGNVQVWGGEDPRPHWGGVALGRARNKEPSQTPSLSLSLCIHPTSSLAGWGLVAPLQRWENQGLEKDDSIKVFPGCWQWGRVSSAGLRRVARDPPSWGLALPKPGQPRAGDSFLVKPTPANHHHPGLDVHQLWLQSKCGHGPPRAGVRCIRKRPPGQTQPGSQL